MRSEIPIRSTRRRWLLGTAALLVLLLAAFVALLVHEISNSGRQAAWFSQNAARITHSLLPGPSEAIRFPRSGPFDEHLGYTEVPRWTQRLQAQGWTVAAQSRMSTGMLDWADRGLYVPYREKTQAGLSLADCRGTPLYGVRYPERQYASLEEVPRRLVDALVHIENRELFSEPPQRNPAVEWDRFAKAVVDQTVRRVDSSHAAAGGSTLATQIEKFRHSPGGRTGSVGEKLRQMVSASQRAYMGGADTLAWRRQIVLDYINTVPLSAQAGVGEVHGLGDGLWAWYGRDFAEINQALSAPADGPGRAGTALAFKQALSLLVAQRRPAFYLSPVGSAALRELTDSHLRLLAQAGVIGAALRDEALPLPLSLQTRVSTPLHVDFGERKAVTALRSHLQGLLGVPRAYDLARLDLSADSPVSEQVQRSVTALLRTLNHKEGARAAGLLGPHMLSPGTDPSHISFSFTLYERSEGVNLLRVQTDNGEQPLDINEGTRLDLGSTAKLRTLVTYLEQVAALHARWQALDGAALARLDLGPRDAIALWARKHLQTHRDRSLQAMLAAAMQRSYSASNGEAFFTGGGLHRFGNFESADNSRRMTVAEAFTRSVNLVFIRLMRDVVLRVAADMPTADPRLLDDVDDPRRRPYLQRFADQEGNTYLTRFYRKYQGRTAAEAEELLLQNLRPTPVRLAAAYYLLEPQADVLQLLEFLGRRLPGAQGSAQTLHDRYGPGKFSLQDRGYLAGLHPLELWLAGHLRQHPQATLTQVLAASREQRQEVYAWLFQNSRKAAQDRRIRTLLEIEAFEQIHAGWQRLGYPFKSLTPSYATALGASGDRPAALAELMGIIVGGGQRLPVARVTALRAGVGTPFETHLAYRPEGAAQRVLREEVAHTVREALAQVVDAGTGRRLKGALTLIDGTPVAVGGKTGTGDHRFDTFGRGGQLLSSRIVSRSATIVFMLGDRHFGTLMAFVKEPYAARYRFTSALPSQLLKALAPQLVPLLDGTTCAPTAP